MIPSVISPEIKSNAERRVFEWFKSAKGTESWIVLHSLGIANHNKVIHGEIDFFVLAPGFGLFALEVKGGRVSRKDGVWFFTDKHGNTSTKIRGPFEQAWDGVHSIVNDIKSKLDYNYRHLNRLFFGMGVMFPDIEYAASGSDEEQWQVFDVNDKGDIHGFIRRLSSGAAAKYKEKFGYSVSDEQKLSISDAGYIADLLRRDFDRAVALSVLIRHAEQEMITLTKEQYRCIDQLEDNPRCLIRGGAGTGKTLIAVQETMKAVASEQKVALFCFNNNLGKWLNKCFPDASLQPEYAGSFHKFLNSVLLKNNIEYTFPQEGNPLQHFYQDIMPELALNALRESLDKFDVLIIDEAQDLISSKYLEVFDAMLSGGLTRGRWRMFGDFSMQAIYADGLSPGAMLDLLEKRTAFIKFKLTINCRNTKPICEEICTVTGYTPTNDMWMKVDGPPVQYLTYLSINECEQKIQQVIEDLMSNGVSAEKITILSPVKRENSAVGNFRKYRISEYRVEGNDTISFCTIQGFKGLENTVIILVDITSFENQQLMYVAFSRAVAGLYVIESNDAAKEYLSLQKRRFLK
jgi:hypothetical protein